MAEFEKVANVSDIKPGEIKSFVVGNEMVAICNSDGTFYAFLDECSHQALPLSDGLLEGKTLTCAYHGAEFDVESGEPLCMPAAERIDTYEVKIEGEDIYVSLPD